VYTLAIMHATGTWLTTKRNLFFYKDNIDESYDGDNIGRRYIAVFVRRPLSPILSRSDLLL